MKKEAQKKGNDHGGWEWGKQKKKNRYIKV